MPSFIPSIPANSEINGQYDHALARCSLRTIGNNTLPYTRSKLFTPITTAWTHMDFNTSVGEGDTRPKTVVTWLNSDGLEVVALNVIEAPSAKIYMTYNNGAAWIQAGPLYGVEFIDKQTLDIRITVGGSGRIQVYNGGTKVIESGPINLTPIHNIAGINFSGYVSGFGTGVGPQISQCIIANQTTIGWRMDTYVPSGAGSLSDWTGDYTDIDEVVYNDANFISTPTANAVSNFALTPVGAPDGSEIKAFVVTARARTGGAGPQNLQLNVNTDGTDFFSPSILQDAGFLPNIGIWETNPNTGVKWVDADLVDIKGGVKAIA